MVHLMCVLEGTILYMEIIVSQSFAPGTQQFRVMVIIKIIASMLNHVSRQLENDFCSELFKK